jgi:hypothetical protein
VEKTKRGETEERQRKIEKEGEIERKTMIKSA